MAEPQPASVTILGLCAVVPLVLAVILLIADVAAAAAYVLLGLGALCTLMLAGQVVTPRKNRGA